MKTIEWRWPELKLKYQPGPWMAEPDKVQWVDQTGLVCLIHRNRLGALCGYVGVPKGHRYFKTDYDDVEVDVHGGLTYAGFCQEAPGPDSDLPEGFGVCHAVEPGEDDVIWWLGFDCAHFMDYIPGMDTEEIRGYGLGSANPVLESEFPKNYKDIEYVRREVVGLARQLSVS